jgi:hypothetical protein
MSLEEVQLKIGALSSNERRRLLAFMVVLEDCHRPDYAVELARRIDGKSPNRWLTPEQCERELGLDSR